MMLLGIAIVLLGIYTYLNLFVAVKMVEQARKDEAAWKYYWKATTEVGREE